MVKPNVMCDYIKYLVYPGGMCTVSKVLYHIGIIKLIPVSYLNDK